MAQGHFRYHQHQLPQKCPNFRQFSPLSAPRQLPIHIRIHFPKEGDPRRQAKTRRTVAWTVDRPSRNRLNPYEWHAQYVEPQRERAKVRRKTDQVIHRVHRQFWKVHHSAQTQSDARVSVRDPAKIVLFHFHRLVFQHFPPQEHGVSQRPPTAHHYRQNLLRPQCQAHWTSVPGYGSWTKPPPSEFADRHIWERYQWSSFLHFLQNEEKQKPGFLEGKPKV